jgi:non-ribosomal peptide synthetase component F
VTLNTLVQAALAQVIADRTGNDRIAFGVTGSGRTVDLPGVEDIIDLMVGTLPLVCDAAPALETDAGKGEWLRGILADNIAMRQHEHAPPPAVQSWTDAPAAPFDTLMVFENYPVDEALWHEVRGDLSFSDVGNRGGTSYPLTVIVVPRDTLSFHIEYRRAFFGREEADGILAALVERLLAIGEE